MSYPIPVQDAAPYPPIQASGPNIRAAQKIGQALGCAKGELSAITGYEYQGWVLAARHPDLAEMMCRIAKVEMHHLDMLGRLIVKLGGDPRYTCAQYGGCSFWNSGMLSYSRDARAILTGNIADEKKAMEFYQQTAREISDPLVSVVLNRIALDEKLHVSILTRCLQELDTDCR